MNDLPADLISFLTSADSLVVSMNEGEVQKAEFLPLDDLKLDRFRVDSERHDDEGEAVTSEEFEGYSLLKTADGYDPDGVLIWFPDRKEYGAWDCDHHVLITFPNVTWSEILPIPHGSSTVNGILNESFIEKSSRNNGTNGVGFRR